MYVSETVHLTHSIQKQNLPKIWGNSSNMSDSLWEQVEEGKRLTLTRNNDITFFIIFKSSSQMQNSSNLCGGIHW